MNKVSKSGFRLVWPRVSLCFQNHENHRILKIANQPLKMGTFYQPLLENMRWYVYNFLFLIWWTNWTQSASLLLWNYILILKIIQVTRFKDPDAAVLTLKMLPGSHLWFCKIIPEAAHGKLILAPFPCSQWEIGTIEKQWPITEKIILKKCITRRLGSFSCPNTSGAS